MAVDAYAPCPCGSGQKFKWCCQKVEAYAEKAQRLFEGGQIDAAVAAADEGLRKVPGNPWLTIRKAVYLIRDGREAEAKPVLEQLVQAHPEQVGGRLLLFQAVLVTEGPIAGVAHLQQVLPTLPPERREGMVPALRILAGLLREFDQVPAALKHLELAIDFAGGRSEAPRETLRLFDGLMSDANQSPWSRNIYRLAPPPADLDEGTRDRFAQALGWAGEGLWSGAAAAFETLAADGVPEADRNLGLCRLWMTEDTEAIAAIRRYLPYADESEDAVDLESLCQVMAVPERSDLVDEVHWIWTLRDRDRLLAALNAADRAEYEGTEPLDPDDPQSVEVESFDILDRPKPSGAIPTDPRQLPTIRGRVLVGQEIVILEGIDDGRLDGLSNWLSEVAGPAIPPAHPKSKQIRKVSRTESALQVLIWASPDLPAEQWNALAKERSAWITAEIWPKTPMPYLQGRTPLQAAKAGDARVALRAALCRMELRHEAARDPIDLPALRARLEVPAEPAIDPETVDLERLHIARLHQVPAASLDDDRLARLYDLAHRAAMILAIEHAALAIIERPGLLARPETGPLPVFSDLATVALSRGGKDEARKWLERGRQADPDERGANAADWDMIELRLLCRSEPPETWVPYLAVILDRYRDDPDSSITLLTTMVGLGLVQASPHPDQPGEFLLDSRPLQNLLARFGPRITTPEGNLGISAAQGKIWTPGSDAGTPGGGKKLILPGS